MKIDISELQKRSEHITCKEHPTLPLLIWNYNHKCQWAKAWDEFTVQTRGLITDKEGNILYRPFKKFFNLGETEETKLEHILGLGSPKIYEKLDGSLGIQYYDGDIPQIATRGSFTSDQAIWASKWIESRYTKEDFLEGYTYIYEIVYPENRIMIDYGERAELVLLAVIETETGAEINYIPEAKKLGLNYAEPFEGSFAEMQLKVESLKADKEGFVLVYPGDHRVKMKGEEYVRVHRLISTLSSRAIWEALKEKGELENMNYMSLSVEIRGWIAEKVYELNRGFEFIQGDVEHCLEEMEENNITLRKEQAAYILEHYKDISSIVFAALDDKDYTKLIWNHIEPVYETPFRNNDMELEEI